MRKILALLLTGTMLCTLGGCGQKQEAAPAATGATEAKVQETTAKAAASAQTDGKQEIEVMMYASGQTQELDDAIYNVIDQFTADTGIKVTLSMPGEGYEELLKTRMASNDLPDVFCTHGWAVVRYGEYLLPLNDQGWSDNISSAIKSVITDEQGNILVLPSTHVLSGIDVNYDVLAEAGVDPAGILTWADFEDACEKVQAIGKTPISMGGKESWTAAQIFQGVCNSTLTKEDKAAIADGTFDWNVVTPICERYVDWVDRGFFNVEVLTADYNTCCQMLASGDAAFVFSNTGALSQGWSYYPEANLGVIPMPSNDPAVAPIGVAGEQLSWGIWKDSDHIEAARTLLDYLARPEHTKMFAEAMMSPAGMSDADYDLGTLTEDIKKLASYETQPIWDRTLPSGMFNDLSTVAQSILAKESDAVAKGIKTFSDSYKEKME